MNWKLRALIGIVAAGTSQCAWANEPTVDRGSPPDWVADVALIDRPVTDQGLIFFRYQDSQIHLDATGASQHLAWRARLLHPQALQLGNIAISWDTAAGNPVVHKLIVHRDGEAVDVLADNEFTIFQREDQLEQAMLDGIRTATLNIPDLRVGDEIELAYTLRVVDPTMGPLSYGAFFIGAEPPGGRYHMRLSWDEGQAPEYQLTDDLQPYLTKGSRELVLKTDNPPSLNPPSDAPPRYSWQRVLEYSDFSDWREISRHFAPIYADAAQLGEQSPVRAEAARIRAAHSGKFDQAAAALKLVQEQVRYIYVGLNGGNLTPANADETWRRRYGDCKGKTALLLGLLNELDIPAEAVIVSNSGSDGYDDRLPSVGLFDHVLVRAEIGGERYWLDGTLPPVVPPGTSSVVAYDWVLPATERGADLERVEQSKASAPDTITLYEIDARAGFEEPARQTTTTITRGIKGVGEYAAFSQLTPGQLESSYRRAVVGQGGFDTIESVRWQYDSEALASILTVVGTGPVDWDGETRKSLSLPGGGFNPPPRRIRAESEGSQAPFYNEPGYSCHVTTVRLPEDTQIENWGFNTTFDTKIFGRIYYRMMEKRGDLTLRMIRGSRVEETEISVATAERDNGRLDGFDNSMANISYDPQDEMHPWGNLRPVPAVDEIDWTGTDVPCLPPDVLRGG